MNPDANPAEAQARPSVVDRAGFEAEVDRLRAREMGRLAARLHQRAQRRRRPRLAAGHSDELT